MAQLFLFHQHNNNHREMLEKPPVIIAHRGFSAISPENTKRAVVDAVENGADYVEIDVQLTQDGHVIVLHDSTVDRTTNGSGAVAQLPLAELRQLDAGSWKGEAFAGEKVPTLEELIELFVAEKYSAKLLIELKFEVISRRGVFATIPQLEDKVVALIEKHKAFQYVVVQSFVKQYLLRILELNERIAVSHLLLPWVSMSDERFYSFNPNYKFLSASLIQRAHARGQKVMPWTVDKKEEMMTCLAMGVDGIITNEPLRLKHMIETVNEEDLKQYAVQSGLRGDLSVIIALFVIIVAYFWFRR